MRGIFVVVGLMISISVSSWAQEPGSSAISLDVDAENPLRGVPSDAAGTLRRLPPDPDAPISPRTPGSAARAWMQGLRDELRGEDSFRAIVAVVKLRDMGAAGASTLVETLKNPNLDQPVCLSVMRALNEIGPAAVPALVRGLEDVNDKYWEQVCQIIESHGRVAAPATPMLVRILSNPALDLSRRVDAARLLRTIGPDARDAIPTLLDVFEREQEFNIRDEAINAVAAIGRVSADNADRLLQFLLNEENDDRLRLAVSSVLVKQEQVSPAVLPVLIGMLDPVFGEDTCVAAANVISQLGPEGAPALPALESLLEQDNETMRMAVVTAIGRISGNAEPVTGKLVQLAQSIDDRDAQKIIGSAFKRLGPSAMQELFTGLSSPDVSVRENTLMTISAIGPQAKAAQSVIVQLLQDAKYADSHLSGIQALQAIHADAALATAPLVRIVTSTSERLELRSAAAAALSELASDAQQILSLFTDILHDQREEPAMRAVAALSLGQMVKTVVPDLFQALQDQSLEVRLAAAKALCLHDDSREQGIAALIRELSFPENADSVAIVLEWAGPLAVPQLGIVLRDKNTDVEHRIVAARVLERIGGGPASEFLVQAMEDENEDLSKIAEDLLLGIGRRHAMPPLIVAISNHEAAALREPHVERHQLLAERMKKIIVDMNDFQGGPGNSGSMAMPPKPSPANTVSPFPMDSVIGPSGSGGSSGSSGQSRSFPMVVGEESSGAKPPVPPSEDSRTIGGNIQAQGAEVKPAWKIVKVFYGTNRKPLNTVSERRFLELKSYFPVIAVGSITMLLSTIGFLRTRSLGKAFLAGVGLIATLALAYPATRQTIKLEQSAYGRPGPAYGVECNSATEIGSCDVSIPATHKFGALESPEIYEITQDPNRHIVVRSVRQLESDDFHTELKQHLAERGSNILVFVHGYNVNFDDAARRTAQMAADLEFPGAPLFFSWPSQGNWYEYREDERQVEMAVTPLKQFLLDVCRRSGAESIHLVAHSMGNRALTAALREIELEATDQQKLFNQVVLAAPDIDAGIFRTRIVPAIQAKAKRVTLYASSNDLALVASRTFNSGDMRAGDTSRGVIVVPGIETIDVSEVDTSLLGHSYYGDNPTVLTDLKDLLRNTKPADDRASLEPQTQDDLKYWIFRAVNALSRTESSATQR